MHNASGDKLRYYKNRIKCNVRTDMRNIETKWLQDFLTLADLRNFSLAAAERNITQPAFSRRLKSLESEIGLELVDRSKSPIELTMCGKQFRTTAQSILRQMDEEISRLDGRRVHGQHTVRIAAAHSIAISLLPMLHSSLFESNLDINVAVDTSKVEDAVELLIDGKCDFLFSFYDDRLHVAPYRSIYLGRSYLYCVSAIDPNSGEALFDATNENCAPFVTYSQDSYMGKILQRAYGTLGNQSICTSSMTDLIKSLVLQGKGISWLPDYAIKDELANGDLKILSGKEPVPLDLYVYRYCSKLHSSSESIWVNLNKNSPMKELNK